MAVKLNFPGFTRRREQLEQRSLVPYSYGNWSSSIPYSSSQDSRLPYSPSQALDPFQASEVAYRCQDLIATSLSSLDLVLREDEEYIETNEIANRFNKSSSDAISAAIHKRVMWFHLEQRGECFIFMDRGETGEEDPSDFIVIYSPVIPKVQENFLDENGLVRPRSNREKISPTIIGYEVQTEWGPVPLKPSEVLWLRYPHPNAPWQAMPPSAAAVVPAGLDRAAREWQAGEFMNSARPSGVYNAGPINEQLAQKIKAKLESEASGARNAGRTLVLYGNTGKTGFDRVSLTPAEMSYIESHQVCGADICVAYGVPIDLVFGQSTYENQQAAFSRAWATWMGKLSVVEAEIDRQLFPEIGQDAVFDIRKVAALQENTDALYERAIKATTSDLVTLNQAAKMLGLEGLGDRGEMTLTEYRVWCSAQTELNQPQQQQPDKQTKAKKQEPGVSIAAQEIISEIHYNSIGSHSEISALTAAELLEIRRLGLDRQRIIRFFDRHERLIKRVVSRLAEKQRRVVLRIWSKYESKLAKALEKGVELPPLPTTPDLFDKVFWTSVTIESLEASLDSLYSDSASMTAESLGMEISTPLLERVVEAMRARLEVLASDVSDTTYETIEKQLLKEGVQKGESISELSGRLKDTFEDLETWRAETIARTETLAGFSSAARIAYLESGVVKARIWRVTNDDRVRETHKVLEGHRTTGLFDRYPNGLLFPGDPAGSPSETIQCRCYEELVLEGD